MDAKVTKCGDVIRRDGMNYPCQSNYPCDIHHASQVIAGLRSQLANAMNVLSPSMSESGLVDACRQVKQAAISEAGNARKLEALLADRDAQLAAANARASELFNELGIVQNEAATQRGELERQIAEMRKAIESLTNPICEDCPHRYLDHTESYSDCDQPCKLCPCSMFEDDMGKMHDAYEAARSLVAAEIGLEAGDGR